MDMRAVKIIGGAIGLFAISLIAGVWVFPCIFVAFVFGCIIVAAIDTRGY